MQENLKFQAKALATTREEDIVLVGFADDQHDPTDYLILERGLSPESQDISIDQDKTYVEIRDQKWSAYGAIKSVSLSRNVINMLFWEAAQKKLRIVSADISFDCSDDQWELLRDSLSEMAINDFDFAYNNL